MFQGIHKQEQQLEASVRSNEPPPIAGTGFVGGVIYIGVFIQLHISPVFKRTAGGFPPSFKVTLPDGAPDTNSAPVIVYFAVSRNF